MNDAQQLAPGLHIFIADSNVWKPGQDKAPCPIGHSTAFFQAELDVEQHREECPDAAQTPIAEIAEQAIRQEHIPDWLRSASMTDHDRTGPEFIHWGGPLACRHEGCIKSDSRIVGIEHDVHVDDAVLSPSRSLKLRNHSPSGFSWGYGGSGPSQLALALLLEAGASDAEATSYYQSFKFLHIATLPDQAKFVMEGRVVTDWLENQRDEAK